MLKFKATVIIICAVTLLFSITVSALTLINPESAVPETTVERTPSSMYSYNSGTEKERTFDLSVLSSTPVSNSLTYSGTATEDKNFPLDVYCDTYNNEYFFDKSDNVFAYIKGANMHNTVGVYPDFKQSKDFTGDKSSKAAEIAADFAGKLYGDSFNEYKLTSSKEKNGNFYDVKFGIPLGEDGLFSRNNCTVRVDVKGNIIYCVKSVQSIPDDFDVSLLEGVTEKMLTQYAIKEASAILGEVKTMEIRSMKLRETDNGYAAVTEVFFTLDTDISNDIFDKYEINLFNSLYTYSINIYYPLS